MKYVALLSVALCACPRLPPQSGCAPLSWRCNNDAPEVCSESQRWHQNGDSTCASSGAVCTLDNATGRANCVRAPAESQ